MRVFWKQCKVLLAPPLIMLLIVVGYEQSWGIGSSGAVSFLLELLLGMALGAVLGLMPILYGSGAKERFVTQRWFACGLVVLIIAYQYGAANAGVRIPWIDWLRIDHSRVLLGEGCLLGYCIIGALRAKR